jgi:tetratricopeptide (TPR) repeat protein
MSDRNPEDPYERAIDAARGRVEDLQREIETAAALLEELAAQPGPERSELIRTEVRFHGVKLCDLLMAKCREAWSSDPLRAVELAALAVEIAERLDAGHYGEGLVADEKALAWAYLANASRVASDLRRAEEALAHAEEHQLQGEDALVGAQILSFKASLWISQGRYADAARLLDQVVLVYREAKDRHLEGKALIQKATALGYAGSYREATRTVGQGLARVSLLEEPSLLVAGRHNLVYYLNESGKHWEALAVLRTTRAVYEEFGERLHLLRLRWLEGRIQRDLGLLSGAEAAFQEARAGFIERGIAFDAARVSLDLATVYLKQKRTSELKKLTAEMVPIFESRDVHQEALAALLLFRRAVDAEEVTVDLLQKISDYLQRARHNPGLRFEGGLTPRP